MRYLKFILILLGIKCLVLPSFACSCQPIYFCNELHSNDSLIAFKGVVFDSITYDGYNQAVYVKVVKVYRDDFGLTDTIKLYGKTIDADCSIDVISAFRIGDTVRVLAKSDYKPAPPQYTGETYYENYLFSCLTSIIFQEGDLARGRIFWNENQESVRKYPASLLDQALKDCDFGLDQLCGQDIFEIFPNPAGNSFQFTSKLWSLSFDKVSLYSINGTRVREYTSSDFEYGQGLDISGLAPGLYLVEIFCDEQRILKKLVIQ